MSLSLFSFVYSISGHMVNDTDFICDEHLATHLPYVQIIYFVYMVYIYNLAANLSVEHAWQ